MSNRLQYENSPYLLQHKDNPVDWYPWCGEAFRRAREEDKPVFLSIGYSTCHWCHVMAHESFEDPEIAGLLNRFFISVKVDREERPDIDSIYMAVCQAFTGSGGWPTSIFMTAEQKPFFAGTYFPPRSNGRMAGLRELLELIHARWQTDRASLLRRADRLADQLNAQKAAGGESLPRLPEEAAALYRRLYDPVNGGFGPAPKFPAPHNLLFLLTLCQRRGDRESLDMAEKTLVQMYRGGLFDHIGGGFCRYSTDERFLVPHFEKMLYDNALLILAYSKAYAVTGKELYRTAAQKTADYVLRELTAPEGGFCSAQDADSAGREGAYYLLTPEEVISVLGEENGAAFNRRFGITAGGNFEGQSIPNLLSSDPEDASCDPFLPRLRRYRGERHALHLDDKVLTAWNGLMIAALCRLFRAGGGERYLDAARRAEAFFRGQLRQGGRLSVSFRAGKWSGAGFLDDYACFLFAQLALYEATLEEACLTRAKGLCQTVISEFQAPDGGFYLYGAEHEQLILRPKETYDGAMPSGNSMMAWALVRLSQLFPGEGYDQAALKQLNFLSAEAAAHPVGHAMFLLALLDHQDPPAKVTVVPAGGQTTAGLPRAFPEDTVLRLQPPGGALQAQNGKTTFYVCRGQRCLPPVNDLEQCLTLLRG